jgi:hypothetical protein
VALLLTVLASLALGVTAASAQGGRSWGTGAQPGRPADFGDGAAARQRPVVRTPAPSVRPTRRPRVLVYGDSLIYEAQTAIAYQFGLSGVDVVVRAVGGTAICDWLGDMSYRVGSYRPDLTVVEFSGNYISPCMVNAVFGGRLPSQNSPSQEAAVIAKYAADSRTATMVLARYGADVMWAAAPAMLASPRARTIGAGYQGLSSWLGNARFVDAGDAVAPGGQFVWRLPCQAFDRCAPPATVQVRAPDGTHFCPVAPPAVRGVTGMCKVWSSGAWRFSAAITTAAVSDLRGRGLL